MSNVRDNVVQGDFSALGHAGSDHFIGLEIIQLPEEMEYVSFTSDEFTAVCPVTRQPDLYNLEITLYDTMFSIESKSLKIYLNGFRQQGCFAENLARVIKQNVHEAILMSIAGDDPPAWNEDQITVVIWQKSRGGISIEAKA